MKEGIVTERLLQIVPALVFCLMMFVSNRFYTKWLAKNYGKMTNDIEWAKTHRAKLFLLGLPMVVLFGPSIEELIFRAPLIILFPAMGQSAWYGVVVSSVLFGIAHWFGNFFVISNVLNTKKTETNDLVREVQKAQTEKRGSILVFRGWRVLVTTAIGFLFAYIAITRQSLWMVVVVHGLWNLVMPIILPLLFMVLFLLVQCIFVLPIRWVIGQIEESRYQRQRRRRLMDELKRL